MPRRIHLSSACGYNGRLRRPAAPAVAQNLPFTVTEVADFDIPWAMAFLPDGRMLVTEQRGMLKLYTPGGASVDIRGVPQVSWFGKAAWRRRAASRFRDQRARHLSYAEAGEVRRAAPRSRGRSSRSMRQRRRAAKPPSHLAAIAEGRRWRPLQPPHRVRRRVSVAQLR